MSKYVADAKEFFDALTGEETRWSGLCLWFPETVAKTSPVAGDLLAQGCKWSGKRGAWYWRHEEA